LHNAPKPEEPKLLAITDGPLPYNPNVLSSAHWDTLSQVQVQMEAVDKEGSKLYSNLEGVKDSLSFGGKGLMTQLESLMVQLDDHKAYISKMNRFKKLPDGRSPSLADLKKATTDAEQLVCALGELNVQSKAVLRNARTELA